MGNIGTKLEEIQSGIANTINIQDNPTSQLPTEQQQNITQISCPSKTQVTQGREAGLSVKIELPHSSDMLTVGWFMSEIERKIKEEKFFDVTAQLLKDKKIVALKCKTSKSECMDFLLTQPHQLISFIQDRDIIETVYSEVKQKKKRRPHLEDFDFLKVIGRGGFSTVFQVRRKDDGMIFAMKCLKKSQIKRENKVRHVMNERQILTQVSHPFIVKMQWAFQSEHYLFMVLEFCAGGEIFYHMNKVQRFSEKVAKFYFAEIILAIEYLHSNNIFYRDLKPENILLDEEGHVKLADFGISRINFSERDRSTSFCGSPEYMSPEMLKQGRVHGRCVDYYALGALLYEMLTGLPPHFSENRDEMYRKIMHKGIEYPRYLSPMAKSFLKALLIKNPEQRLGAHFGVKEIKDHPFCRDIDWEAVIEKRTIPPIRPSLRYSNFDPEYTSIPVRFTFEEDLVRDQFTRRKSDPGMDNYFNHVQHSNNLIPGGNQFEIPNQFSGHAIVYPSFAFERRGELSSFKGSQQSNNHQKIGRGMELLDDQSPNYSRPPSSTFRGYSFMNFRNDSISSGDNQMTFSDASLKVNLNQQQPSNRNQNIPQQVQISILPLTKTLNSNINIIEDYQFTQSQRSRSISFANQSILTEGIEQQNIYKMDFQGFNPFFNEICFKANEFEFNSYNYQFPKKWQYQNLSVKQQKPHQSFIGLSQSHSSNSKGDQETKTQSIQSHLKEQALYNNVMNNFEYSGVTQDPQSIWGGAGAPFKKMSAIQEDDENEGGLHESQAVINNQENYEYDQGSEEDGNNSASSKQKRQSELMIGKVTSRLISDKHKKLDKYGKNLIRYYDVINHVFSERKRKTSPQKDLQNINTDSNRKGAQSLFTNQNPLGEPNSRIRVESNYTSRSGGVDKIIDTSQDRRSLGGVRKSPSKILHPTKERQGSNYSNQHKYQSNYQKTQMITANTKQLQIGTGSGTKNNPPLITPKSNMKVSHHTRMGSQLLSPKAVTKKGMYPDGLKQTFNKSIIGSPSVTHTKTGSFGNEIVLTEDKKNSTTKITFQDPSSAKKKSPINEPNQNAGINKSRNTNQTKTNTVNVQQAATQDKKFNVTSVIPGQLEQIDEFSPLENAMQTANNHQAAYNFTKSYNYLTLNAQQPQNNPGTSSQAPVQTQLKPRKKLSRLNSPKMDIDTPKNSRVQPPQTTTNKAVLLRNRVKTNSQYTSLPSHVNEFKNLLGLAEVNKNTKAPRKDGSPSKSSNKSRIPKSQERELKSASDNTMEDIDENMEEFKCGDTQNRQRLKNPSLMTSIALNSTKHKDNAKDFNQLLFQGTVSPQVQPTQFSTQQTPDQMKTTSIIDQQVKASPSQILGQATSFLEYKNKPAQSQNSQAAQTKVHSSNSQYQQSNNPSSASKGKQQLQLAKSQDDEVYPKQAHQHSKSSIQKNQYSSSNNQQQMSSYHHQTFSQSTISQHQDQRIESPKPSPAMSKNSNKKNTNSGGGRGSSNRHSLWSSKRSEQKTPIKFEKGKPTQYIIDNIDEIEDIKNIERISTEGKVSATEEKMLFSSSEKKFKKE